LFETVADARERGGEVAWQAYAAQAANCRAPSMPAKGSTIPISNRRTNGWLPGAGCFKPRKNGTVRRRPSGIAFGLHKLDRYPGKD